MLHRRPLPAVTLLTVLALTGLVARAKGRWGDEPTRAWREGPIRYLLTVEEDREYRGLRSTGERRTFIEKFWIALDPTPGTESNERRAEFWSRVARSNRLFRDSIRPGWKTPRGKIHILLGPPDEVKTREQGEEWVYYGLGTVAESPDLRLAFRRQHTGEYQLVRGPVSYRDPTAAPGGSPAGSTYLGLDAEGQDQVLEGRFRMDAAAERVEAEFFFGLLPFTSRYDFYKDVQGNAFIALTLSIRKDQLTGPAGGRGRPDLRISGIVTDLKHKVEVERFSQTMWLESSGGRDPGRPLRFRTGFNLPPGSYRASFILFDRETRRGASFSRTLQVPDFSRGLSLSSIAVGRPAGEPPEADPYHLGTISPTPDPEATFESGETVVFSYQVYNARHRDKRGDAGGDKVGDGRPALEVEYRFFLDRGERLEVVGKPVVLNRVTGESLAYALPLTGWPEAKYRLQVQVTDTLARTSARGEARFQVIDPGPSRTSEKNPL